MGHLSRAATLSRALAAEDAEISLYLTAPESAGELPFPVERLDRRRGPDAADFDALVIDGYEFTPDEITIFRRCAGHLTVVDDLGDRPVICDVLVNQNVYGAELEYVGYEASERLLGPRYALIRPEFAAARKSNARSAPRVLVSFGGGETGAIAYETAASLAARLACPIDIAIGGSAPAPTGPLPDRVTIHRGADMPALMAQATLYVGALGVTFLEALAAGLPAVTAPVVDNQKLALGWARRMGMTALDTPDIATMTDAAARLIKSEAAPAVEQPDGRGAERVARALLSSIAPR